MTAGGSVRAEEGFGAGERARHYLYRTYSWQRTALLGIDTGLGHLLDGAAGGAGISRFPSSYGEALARRVSRNSMEFALGMVLKEDPRYRASGQRGLRRRVAYAALHTVMGPGPDGRDRLSFSRLVPALASDVLASSWERRRLTAGGVMAGFGWTLAGDLQTRCLDEFSPDLKRVGQRIGRVLLRGALRRVATIP